MDDEEGADAREEVEVEEETMEVKEVVVVEEDHTWICEPQL